MYRFWIILWVTHKYQDKYHQFFFDEKLPTNGDSHDQPHRYKRGHYSLCECAVLRSDGESKIRCKVTEKDHSTSFPGVIQTASFSLFISNSIYSAVRQSQAGVAFMPVRWEVSELMWQLINISIKFNWISRDHFGRMCVNELGTRNSTLSMNLSIEKNGQYKSDESKILKWNWTIQFYMQAALIFLVVLQK